MGTPITVECASDWDLLTLVWSVGLEIFSIFAITKLSLIKSCQKCCQNWRTKYYLVSWVKVLGWHCWFTQEQVIILLVSFDFDAHFSNKYAIFVRGGGCGAGEVKTRFTSAECCSFLLIVFWFTFSLTEKYSNYYKFVFHSKSKLPMVVLFPHHKWMLSRHACFYLIKN